MDFLWPLKLVIQTHQRSHRSHVTDRRRLTGRQTFVRRVISLFTARCIFSFLSEQCWKENSSDDENIDLRVKQVCGLAVTGGLLDEDFSGHWDVVVVDEFGLFTCERIVVGQSAKLLIRGRAQCTSPEPTHMEYENEDQRNEQEDGRDCAQTLRMKHGWRDADNHLEPMCRATLKCVLWNTRKCDVWDPTSVAVDCYQL